MNNPTIYKSETGRIAVLNAYETLLAKWPVSYEQLVVPTQLGNIFVLQCGEKNRPAVIMLHGSSSNSAMWSSSVRELSQTHCIYCIDIPGEPGKSVEKQYPLTDDSYINWLDDVIGGLGLSTVELVGISLGGWMSAAYAIRYPKKVNKLVLLSPSGIGGQKTSFILKAIPLLLLGEKGRERIARSLYGTQSVSDAAIQYTTFIAEHFNPRTGKIPVFSDEQLQRLTMPILCLTGEKDVMLSSAQTAERIHTLLPHADMRVLPGAGHALAGFEKEFTSFLCNR